MKKGMKDEMKEEMKEEMKKGILLNANELYKNINEELLAQFIDEINGIEFNRYPNNNYTEIKKLYGKYVGIIEDEVSVGNGSDELIGLLVGIFLGRGKTLFTLIPDFPMYNYYVSMNEAELIGYKTKEDGSFNMTDFIVDARKQRLDMIMFSNPNNPTGNYIEHEEIIKLLKAFPDIPVIIDEAYVEFAEDSMVKYINSYKNLYVTRTLSKAYGLAAARIGFLISNKDNIGIIESKKAPYTVNSISQKLGEVVLKNLDMFIPIIEEIKFRRDELYKECNDNCTFNDTSNYSYSIYKSSANFLLVRSKDKNLILKEFKKNNIVVRNFDNDTFRISIGSESENKIIRDILLNINTKK